MKISVILFILITFSGVCPAQVEQTPESSNNYFEINYPSYYYFYRFDKRFHISLPLLNVGVEYAHTNLQLKGFQIGLLFDYFRNLKTATEFGNISERIVLYPSFGFHKTYNLNNDKFSIDLIGDLTGRIGQITTFSSANEFESVFAYYELLDFGLSVGAKLKFITKKRLRYSLGLKHTFFAYVFDKGHEFYDIPSSPRNVTTLTLGLGLNFIKRE